MQKLRRATKSRESSTCVRGAVRVALVSIPRMTVFPPAQMYVTNLSAVWETEDDIR